MFVDMLHLNDLKDYDLTSLSTGCMGGAPCPESIVKSVVNDLHMKDFVVQPLASKLKIHSAFIVLYMYVSK